MNPLKYFLNGILLTLLLLPLQMGFSAPSGNLHVIIVADTLDKEIGSAADVKLMSDKVKEIAKYTELKLNLQVLDGNKRTLANVTKAVKNLKPGANDTVIFYYSGHGYREESKKNQWPNLYLLEDQGIDLNWIYETLLAKKPRFLMVLADCCNNFIPDGAINTLEKGFKTLPVKEVYRRLFLEAKGSILASSSKPGEFSIGSNMGGQYTNQFLKALSTELSSENPNWWSIFSNASKKIEVDMGGTKNVQTPLYKITGINKPKLNKETPKTEEKSDFEMQEVQKVDETKEDIKTDPRYKSGYKKGFKDGYEQKSFAKRANKPGKFQQGYKEGYEEGKAVYQKEQEEESENEQENAAEDDSASPADE